MKKVTIKDAKNLGLLPEEFKMIKKILGRTPNYTELAIYSAMWSEHTSYKNSIKWLKTLPRKGKCLLAEAGSENAGIVDIGENYACVFKIESHNHPSAIEPYQGAATGVGGINRDIFTTGARPIAQLNSLRFGNIALEKTKWLLDGVVRGIGDYGNSFGVPVVSGEVYFDDCYNENPLVNAMSVGIVKKNKIISATAKGIGNPVYIIGSQTGKDGIHGASFASADLNENSAEKITSVQVGDPFMEKILLEATQELNEQGLIVAMQDMGAAGIICSTSEMSARGKVGMKIHLDKVPLRQQDMEPWEILLSESQERMLMIVEKGNEQKVEKILEKWDIGYAIIGEVIKEDKLYFYFNNKIVAEVPASSLVLGGGAPVYERKAKKPKYIKKLKTFNIKKIKKEEEKYIEAAKFLVQLPTIASKRWIYEQYDTMVRTNNITTNFPADAGLINIKETSKILGVTVDCNSHYVWANPYKGAQIAVAEAARNLVCSGVKPLAITNCLNFGNPYNPEVYWQFVEVIRGMAKACKAFNTPVTGGNVSFYNQIKKGKKIIPIFPTPVIGMLGITEKENIMTLAFKQKGDMIYLIGPIKDDINQSQYLINYHKIKESPAPFFDLKWEKYLQKIMIELVKLKLINSAHDVSEGGLFICLLESAIPNKLGFDITTDSEIRLDSFLFGEAQGRVVVTVSSKNEPYFLDFMIEKKVPFITLGHVTKGEFRIDDISYGFVSDYENLYMNAINKIMEKNV
ncbi:MAG: phosphoribosylformylglycinamidine synthase subunit PurL [Bacteroidales bacterium]|nr:phosphoribosylformylglycinamidine synthase subunit PurL [Bacteroidales bacterium]